MCLFVHDGVVLFGNQNVSIVFVVRYCDRDSLDGDDNNDSIHDDVVDSTRW